MAPGILDRKRFFVDALKREYQEIISRARRAETDAAEGAGAIQQEARRSEDAKGALDLQRVAAGHRKRREDAARELETLIEFGPRLRAFAASDAIGVGALVDVSVETDGESEERTLFILPVGAGSELNGPGGDGFVSVITPLSPLGRALQGARAGDAVDVVIQGRDREWTVVDVC